MSLCSKHSTTTQVEIFWVVTPRSIVVGYRRFGGPCCLHPTTTLGGATTQKNLDLKLQQ